jgi:hypothetical protein
LFFAVSFSTKVRHFQAARGVEQSPRYRHNVFITLASRRTGEGIMARLPKFYAVVFASGLALGLLGAQGARAFTLDKSGGTNSDGTAKYLDPDERYQPPAGSRDGTSFRFGGGTVTVERPRSFDGDFNENKDRLFSPLGRPGDAR